MSFNFAKRILPTGTLIQFQNSSPVRSSGLDWTFSSIGISPGDTGLVLCHSKPIYLKILVNERIHNLNMSGFTTVTGCWVHDISIIALPKGVKNEYELVRW